MVLEPLCESFIKSNINGEDEVKTLPTPHGTETLSNCLSLVELRNSLCSVILIIVSLLILVCLKCLVVKSIY